ncbi:MAG TPA: SGNH/GDSL hydrolase family protein [Aldersonia sp.]
MLDRQRSLRQTVPLSVLAAMAIALVTQHAAAALPVANSEYVALGDSWTAGAALVGSQWSVSDQFVPLGCAQSDNNYPKLVARALRVAEFRDASCAGARIANLPNRQAVPFGDANPPQLDRLSRATDLVTVGIGGNDAGLGEAVRNCITVQPPALHAHSCKLEYTAGGVDRITANIPATEAAVVAVVEEIRRRARDADIFLVNYLAGLVEPGCWPTVQVADDDMIWIAQKLREINAMLARAAHAAGAHLVDTYTSSAGHDVCQPPNVRYIEGWIPFSQNGPALVVPIHPNAAGAMFQARTVLAAIGQY